MCFRIFHNTHNALISDRYAVRDEKKKRKKRSFFRKDSWRYSYKSGREWKVAARFIGTGANLLRPILCNVPLADVYSMPRKINGPTWNGAYGRCKIFKMHGKRLARLIRPPWFYISIVYRYRHCCQLCEKNFIHIFFHKFLPDF